MICNCSMAGTMACQTCPTKKWVDEGRVPSKVLFAYNVDVVEVVRCRDCKWYKTMYCKMDRWTDLVTVYVAKANDYCSYGERRKNGR